MLNPAYIIYGKGNRLLLLTNGQYVEHMGKIPKLLLNIQGDDNIIKLDDIGIIAELLQITIRGSGCFCHIGGDTKTSYPSKIGRLNIYIGCQGARVDIGEHPVISYNVGIHCSEPYCQCHIGKNVSIGEGVRIYASDAHPVVDVFTHKVLNYGAGKRELRIGDNSWIGLGAFVGKNGSMPEYTIVGAHSVVVKPVSEKYCVVAGNPAKIVKSGVMRMHLWQDAFKLERESSKNIKNEVLQSGDHQQELITLKEQLSHRDIKKREDSRNSGNKPTDTAMLLLAWFDLQRCRLGSHFLFGKARQHYMKKKRMLRRKIGKVGEQLKP